MRDEKSKMSSMFVCFNIVILIMVLVRVNLYNTKS